MDSVFQAGVVSAPLQVLIDKVATLTINETSKILEVDEEARKLKRTLERIRAMAGHVEENNGSMLSNGVSQEAWKVWLEDAENLLYSADDLLDGVLLDLLKHGANLSSDGNQVRSMLLSSLKLTVPHEIRSIRQQLDEIAKEMEAIFMAESTKLSSTRKPCYSGYSCARSSLVDEGSVVGRDTERNEIVGMLLDEGPGGDDMSVIPVVGMGGIGKTAVAQVVFNNERVVRTFELRMWASVSTDFDIIRITKSIIESRTGERCKLSNLEGCQVKLRELIIGRRFLLVLDDYWSEKYADWDVLSAAFRFGSRGSKIITTTRSTTVSRILATVPPIYLEPLSNENCWELMRQVAVSNGPMEYHLRLEEIGRRIASKCKGLPLAAKTLGSMLRFKDDPEEWTSVLESDIWDLPHDKCDLFPALALSYYHLPAHLKKCFAYCSIFPKNYDFEKNDLVLLWMAHRLIRPGKIRPEDIGSTYFEELLSRSFFQFSHVNVHGQRVYKMHDLIHGMAEIVSARTCLRVEDSFANEEHASSTSTRHFSLNCQSTQPITLEGYYWYKNLRTFRVRGNVQISYNLFLELKFLRELDLSCMGLHELHDSIGHLKHLRYLNLSNNRFKKLPESIGNLVGLETLNLERCLELLELPSNTRNLVCLRHLYLDVKNLNCMPREFGKLVNLQSLSAFIVGRNEGCRIGELKFMKSLRQSLCIKNLENVLNVIEAEEAMLEMKPFIDKLELEWSDSTYRQNDGEVLAGLRPHENLKDLLITNYSGFLFPGWFSSRCNISSIHLQSCRQCGILMPLGELPHLKSLIIEGMSELELIDQEFSGFPKLESLTVKEAPNLISWRGFFEDSFTCLRTFNIDDCPKLVNLPSILNLNTLLCLKINRCPLVRCLPEDGFPFSLEALIISECDIIEDRCRIEEGEDWYKIRSIPKIEIDYVEIPMEIRRL